MTASTITINKGTDDTPNSGTIEDCVDRFNAHAEKEDAHHTLRKGLGWGRGIVTDFKRTTGTHWKKEMINLNGKTIAASFFLYFACISPAVTFGAIYGQATKNYIGAIETILATSGCGIFYALVGGQPMMINGGTGPVLAFTQILYKMSESMDVPFLTLNAWVGTWVCVYLVLAAFVDLNRVIVLCTRFTDEIFGFLIALIFVVNAIGSPFSKVGVIHYFNPNHKSHDPYEDNPSYSYIASALLSLVLFSGTTLLALLLRKFKFSAFLPNQTCRNVMTDYAVVISVLVMSVIGNSFSEVPVEKLNVPSKLEPTFKCCDNTCETEWPTECPDELEPFMSRPWLVDLGNLNGKTYVPFLSAGIALLAFTLVFLDDGITWHLCNHPSHQLKHGDAYNYDTVIIGVMIFISSLFGLPWLSAATLRSLNHIHAMAEKSPNGTFLSVHETRLSGLLIHLLGLATVFALNVLKLLPVPVLYGVFMLMGILSLGTNQFWGRMLMFFMQPSKYPLQPYTKYMKPRRIHLFTFIQLLLFVAVYVVCHVKAIGIAFPIVLALCIPFRLYILTRIFSKDELILIDSEESAVKLWIEKNDKSNQEATEAFVENDVRNAETPNQEMSTPNIVFAEERTMVGPQVLPHIVHSPSLLTPYYEEERSVTDESDNEMVPCVKD